MSLPLQPLGDKILIKEKKVEQKTSNIIIADMGEERPLSGEVIAVGPGRLNEFGTFVPNTLEVGDTVFFPKFGPIKITIDGTDYIVCKENEILVKLNKI